MVKTKLEDKTVGIFFFFRIAKFASSSQALAKFANTSQSVRKVANFAMHLRNWQGCCEVGNAFAKLAMRNFAKLLKFYVRSEFRKCTVHCG